MNSLEEEALDFQIRLNNVEEIEITYISLPNDEKVASFVDKYLQNLFAELSAKSAKPGKGLSKDSFNAVNCLLIMNCSM